MDSLQTHSLHNPARGCHSHKTSLSMFLFTMPHCLWALVPSVVACHSMVTAQLLRSFWQWVENSLGGSLAGCVSAVVDKHSFNSPVHVSALRGMRGEGLRYVFVPVHMLVWNLQVYFTRVDGLNQDETHTKKFPPHPPKFDLCKLYFKAYTHYSFLYLPCTFWHFTSKVFCHKQMNVSNASHSLI